MTCCGEQNYQIPYSYYRAIAPITSIDSCPCKYDPPFGNCCPSLPLFPRPRCYCEDWCTPCVTYQSSDNYHYLPSPLSGPRGKTLYFCNQPMMPGYSGHIPAYKYHSAGRSFGEATRDTGVILQQREEPCMCLPDRIWEQ